MSEPTWDDVLGEDPDIGVSVRADLFVVEAQSVVDLMLHRGVIHAAIFLQRHRLQSALTAQVGPAPDGEIGRKSVEMCGSKSHSV